MAGEIMRAMADFGDAAGWLVAAVLALWAGRRIVRQNDTAHAEMGEDIKGMRADVQRILTDVAVLRDRSDRTAT